MGGSYEGRGGVPARRGLAVCLSRSLSLSRWCREELGGWRWRDGPAGVESIFGFVTRGGLV